MKSLNEMSLEELWRLFPIQLRPADKKKYQKLYKEEAGLERQIISKNYISNHIGSTSIFNIYAKPIVDILLEFNNKEDMNIAARELVKENYLVMSTSDERISLNKGYTTNGFAEKVFHIHLRLKNDNDELYFRDYLNEFYEVAKSYEKLKLELKEKYEFNRDMYTACKTDFVVKYTKLAKTRYLNRYNRS